MVAGKVPQFFANASLPIEDEGEYVRLTFSLSRTHGRQSQQNSDVVTIMLTPSAYRDLGTQIALGPRTPMKRSN